MPSKLNLEITFDLSSFNTKIVPSLCLFIYTASEYICSEVAIETLDTIDCVSVVGQCY